MNIKEFYNTEFSAFASYSAFRGIGNFIDGAKPSTRKVLCSVRNLKDKIKVASLAARIVDTLEYLHGAVSLEGVISKMAQSFTGTNNLPLLEAKGDFGSVCIQKAGASRYIFVNKEKVYDAIFKPVDGNILIEQEFEGTDIEPQFYVPIVPMILVNGCEGIGTGFAQKILPRNIKDIILYIKNDIKEKKNKDQLMLPYYNGFKGDVTRIGDSFSYEIFGKFERTNSTTITVTELPIGYDLAKYNAVLAKLEDDKIITDFTDKSEPKHNKFLFEIKACREFVKKDDAYILDSLKLIKKVTENFTCIGINNEIVEFKSDKEILDAYIKVRLDFYEKRKEWVIRKIKEDLFIAGSKFYFIKYVLENKIKLFKETKLSVTNQIESKIVDFPFYKVNDSFSYLIGMPAHSFTTDTIAELKEDIEKKKLLLKEATDITIQEMWVKDLNDLEKNL
jgi:DNA topoisomerase II